jgi:hypothetical protein
MKKNRLYILAITLSVLMLMGIAPFSTTNAATDPTVMNDVWFVGLVTGSQKGDISWVNDTFGRNMGFTANYTLYRSPAGAGTIVIGNMTMQTNLEINNATGIGNANFTAVLTFSETNTTKNPFGVGTLQGSAVQKVTSMYPGNTNPSIGNSTGTLIASQGTGAFANAVLTIDFLTMPYPSVTSGPTQAMYFGTHSKINGTGILTFYPVPPTVINDMWIVAMTTSAVPGVMSWTNDTDGNIWRNIGFITYFSVLRSPPGTQGSTIIGSMTSQTDLVYNNTAGIGVATITTNMTFSETNSTKNPYGLGTIQGKATNVKVTEMFPPTNPGIGNATGTLLATSGTGNFTNAMLLIDFIMVPFPSAATGPTEAMFFGTHSRVNGRGILTLSTPPLTVSISKSSDQVTPGFPAFFNVTAAGGKQSYTYQWYIETNQVTTATGTNSSRLDFSSNTPSSYNFYCKITDSQGTTTNSSKMNLIVFAQPTPAPTAIPTSAPTPRITPVPTSAPTSTPTVTPASTQDPTPTPTVPEFQAGLLIATFIAIVTASAVTIKVKTKKSK